MESEVWIWALQLHLGNPAKGVLLVYWLAAALLWGSSGTSHSCDNCARVCVT